MDYKNQANVKKLMIFIIAIRSLRLLIRLGISMSKHIQKLSKNNYSHYPFGADSSQSEIDLFELLLKLWDKKQLICLVTMMSTLIAGIYAFTAKEQWTVKTYISTPRIAQISDYLDLRRAFSRVSGTDSDYQGIAQRLFNDFTSMAFSPDEQRSYLISTEYFSEQSRDMDERSKQKLLDEMAEKGLTISPPNEKKNLPYYTISVTAHTPLIAQSLLENYIKKVNDKVIDQDDSEFRYNIAAMIASRTKEKQDIDFVVKAERSNQLNNLTRSLNTAQKAEIKNYYVNTAQKGGTKIELANTINQYMMGEKFLSAEIHTLQNSPMTYPLRYYQIERELSMLEPLLSKRATAQAFRYQLSPGESVQKNRPKRTLILVFGALLGMIAGVGIVLVNSSIERYRCSRK